MDYLSQYYKNLAEQLQEKVVILQNEINEVYRRTPARDAILKKAKRKAQLDVDAATEKQYTSGINNDSYYSADYADDASSFMRALDHLDRINNIINRTVKKVKPVNEASRPTFIPLTTAYDDSNDPAPNVATLTDEEEENLRVDRDADYARLERSLDSYNAARIGTNVEMSRHRDQARRDAMDKIHRGRPLRDYKRSSPTAQKANKEFNHAYRYPAELMDRARGQKVMADISNKILKAQFDHEAF